MQKIDKRKRAVSDASATHSEDNREEQVELKSEDNMQKSQFDVLNEDTDALIQSQLESREQKRKLKKQRKSLIRLCSPPVMKLNMEHLLMKRNNLIKIKDWQSLIMHLLSDGMSLPWVMTAERQNVRQVVCVMVQGILPEDVFADYNAQSIRQLQAQNQQVMYPAPLTVDAVNYQAHTLEKLQSDQSVLLKTSAAQRLAGSLLTGGKKRSLLSLPGDSPLHSIADIIEHAVLTNGPGEKNRIQSPLQALLEVPLTSAQKAQLKDDLDGKQVARVEDYCLTRDDLIANEYPVYGEDEALPEGWLRTLRRRDSAQTNGKQVDEEDDGLMLNIDDGFELVTKNKKKGKVQKVNQLMNNNLELLNQFNSMKILAIDCEMSYTQSGLSLTRVSVVDQHKTVLLDTLVKPEDEITDYNTKYSGITEELMRDVKTTLKDVQHILCNESDGLISEDTILVGHSLENDLNALQIAHDRIIDTSIIYHSNRGPPQKAPLRYLAEKYLNRLIQENSNSTTAGHDSIVDAVACIDLLRLKLEKGYSFGLSMTESESLFKRLQSCEDSPFLASKRKLFGDEAQSELQTVDCCMVDSYKTLQNYQNQIKSVRALQTDADIAEQLSLLVREKSQQTPHQIGDQTVDYPQYNFVFGRFKEVHHAMENMKSLNQDVVGAMQKLDESLLEEGELSVEEMKKTRAQALTEAAGHIRKVYDAMSPSSVLIVLSGLGNTVRAHELIAQRQQYMRLVKEHGAHKVHSDSELSQFVFDEQLMRQLEIECHIGRLGVGLLSVKK
ncbi:hypothetical protein MIR68_001897 [Amoeboaphelidium protococcarum]|nr:hypothetical protein MIR68_001897 [Amoeboaphelidium protococcarum]